MARKQRKLTKLITEVAAFKKRATPSGKVMNCNQLCAGIENVMVLLKIKKLKSIIDNMIYSVVRGSDEGDNIFLLGKDVTSFCVESGSFNAVEIGRRTEHLAQLGSGLGLQSGSTNRYLSLPHIRLAPCST